ncbi:hypothetical protein QBC47DRAFT_2538 [Echria macrotheca]|uniref:Uncharacterized protein n=1 Tax=Echria macrotheca TaxID=438768 RepID=A0AAJ0BL09_9PEZI|nr:hypothetical protein QBC47DRAFT_2538 [Echria macrotheca]
MGFCTSPSLCHFFPPGSGKMAKRKQRANEQAPVDRTVQIDCRPHFPTGACMRRRPRWLEIALLPPSFARKASSQKSKSWQNAAYHPSFLYTSPPSPFLLVWFITLIVFLSPPAGGEHNSFTTNNFWAAVQDTVESSPHEGYQRTKPSWEEGEGGKKEEHIPALYRGETRRRPRTNREKKGTGQEEDADEINQAMLRSARRSRLESHDDHDDIISSRRRYHNLAPQKCRRRPKTPRYSSGRGSCSPSSCWR